MPSARVRLSGGQRGRDGNEGSVVKERRSELKPLAKAVNVRQQQPAVVQYGRRGLVVDYVRGRVRSVEFGGGRRVLEWAARAPTSVEVGGVVYRESGGRLVSDRMLRG